MYERRNHKLLPRKHFVKRVALHVSASFVLAAAALGAGISGYHYLGRLSWIDSFLNASMILGGMGPVDPMETFAAKAFAGVYALFAGLVFIGIAGVMTAPFVHRLLHHIHAEDSPSES